MEAGLLCLAEAEVVQVTIPKDGARLIIGSDGLWDAVHPKTAAHHTREMTAGEASHKLLSMAIKKDHLKDDVTVVVVDVMPPGCTDKVPPGAPAALAARDAGRQGRTGGGRCIWPGCGRPLEDVGCLKWAEEELMRRVDEYAAWRRQEEDREAVIRRQRRWRGRRPSETREAKSVPQRQAEPTRRRVGRRCGQRRRSGGRRRACLTS